MTTGRPTSGDRETFSLSQHTRLRADVDVDGLVVVPGRRVAKLIQRLHLDHELVARLGHQRPPVPPRAAHHARAAGVGRRTPRHQILREAEPTHRRQRAELALKAAAKVFDKGSGVRSGWAKDDLAQLNGSVLTNTPPHRTETWRRRGDGETRTQSVIKL
eukprot:1184200-Prorocentrum_minimum.AAC.4